MIIKNKKNEYFIKIILLLIIFSLSYKQESLYIPITNRLIWKKIDNFSTLNLKFGLDIKEINESIYLTYSSYDINKSIIEYYCSKKIIKIYLI